MNDNLSIIRICEVISVDDPNGGDRIKVRMVPEDNYKHSVSELDFVLPLLPKTFAVKPKVGEAVVVFTATAGNGNSQRYYIGPIVPQVSKMDENTFSGNALMMYPGNRRSMLPSPYLDKSAKGVFPKDDSVSVIGRGNSDLFVNKKDISMRCGIRVPSSGSKSGVEFNRKDPAFIKLKYDDRADSEDGKRSSVNIVADKINLIGTSGVDPALEKIDNDELIDDKEFEKFIKLGHELPFGDYLVDFLKKLRSAFLHHTHPFPMLPPCIEDECRAVADYDLDGMLSDTIRIN